MARTVWERVEMHAWMDQLVMEVMAKMYPRLWMAMMLYCVGRGPEEEGEPLSPRMRMASLDKEVATDQGDGGPLVEGGDAQVPGGSCPPPVCQTLS